MRIFICSTGGDLRAERDAVTAAIHRLRLRHESMEIFGADPAEPVETCIKRVRQSDVLVVIVAHMYGSVVRGRRISFSQMEYEEGFGAGKPCLVYMRDMNQPVLPQHYEREPEKIALLDKWKKVLHARHTVATFTTDRELAGQVMNDLVHLRENGPVASGSQFDTLARSLGLAPERARDFAAEISHNDTLDELRRAMHALMQMSVEQPLRTRKAIASETYLASVVTCYDHISRGLRPEQEALSAFLSSRPLGIQKRFNREDFTIAIDEVAAWRTRIIYLFPFFLVPSRRRTWGVIPYARQSMLGFVLHKDHPAYSILESSDGHGHVLDAGTEPALGPDRILPAGEAVQWIESTVVSAEERHGALFHVDGYVFFEILGELLQDSSSDRSSCALTKCPWPVRSDQVGSLPFSRDAVSGSAVTEMLGRREEIRCSCSIPGRSA